MHGARLSFLALFLVALLRVKTVNLAEVATGFRTNARIEFSAGLLPHRPRIFDSSERESCGTNRVRRRLERIRVRKDCNVSFEILI